MLYVKYVIGSSLNIFLYIYYSTLSLNTYKQIFEIIDERWETQLHRPLHAAAYYLNPHCHYNDNFRAAEMKHGLYTCLEKMVPDLAERVKIDLQLDAFKNGLGLFGKESAVMTRTKKSPG